MSQDHSSSLNDLASQLTDAKYQRLFLSGQHSLADSIWQEGKKMIDLLTIVKKETYSDYARFLSSEILFAKASDYPEDDIKDILGTLYIQAMAHSSTASNQLWISANQWGFMYHTDKIGVSEYGNVGSHLLKIGKPAVPYLTKLLDNNNFLFYEGSREATLGASLHYRVKDAAAYYIGKITGIPVEFYENNAERDSEIERLKQRLK